MRKVIFALLLPVWMLSIGDVAAREAMYVVVSEVREQPLEQTVPVVGRLVACRSGVLATRVEGAVTEMRIEVGDRVEAGDVVVVLDREPARAERDLRAARKAEAEAALRAAAAEIQLRRQELERLGGLRASPAFSKGQFSDKRLEVEMAGGELARVQAALASAQAELRLAEIAFDDTEVRAPYPAAVTERHTEVGAFVAAGEPMVSLVDDRCLEIEADVPQIRARRLAPGIEVRFVLDEGLARDRSADGETGVARVRAVVPEENVRTRTRTVRFVPDLDESANLAANQSVTVHVPAGEARSVLSVPKDAIVTRGGRPNVFVASDGIAELRPVRLGEAVGGSFEVLDGLAAGDLVVVRGNERLRPGQAVSHDAVTTGSGDADRSPPDAAAGERDAATGERDAATGERGAERTGG